jgi:hypothetical protein
VIAALVALSAHASGSARWYELTLLAAVGVILAMRREARVYGMIDLSNPLVMSLVASVVVFGVLGVPNIRASNVANPLLAPGSGPLFRALSAVGVFMLGLWVGSRIAEPLFRLRPQRLNKLAAHVQQHRLFVIIAIGAIARFLLLASGNLGYQGYGKGGDLTGYANWLATANDLLPFAAGLALVDWFTRRRRSSLYTTVALFFVEMLTSIVAGVKGLTLLLLIFLAVTTVRAGRRPKIWVALVIGVLVFTVIAPSVEAFRAQVQHSSSPTSVISRIKTPLSLASSGAGGSVSAAAKTSWRNALLEEQNLIVDIALIQSRTPSIYPYEHGKRWLLAPLIAAVPRAIWPGKPSLSNGGELAVKYSGAAAGTTSMPATTVGDAWIQFGWLGVIGAALALGAFYRFAYTWVARRTNPGWTVALCFVVSTSLFGAGLDVASLLTSAVREFVVLGLFAVWVVRTPSTSSWPSPLSVEDAA